MARATLVLSSVLLAAACTAPAETPPPPAEPTFSAPDEQAIRQLRDDWAQAWVDDDAEPRVGQATPNYFEARATPRVGIDPRRERVASSNFDYSSIHLTVERLEGSGDVAWVWVPGTNRYERRAEGDRRVSDWNGIGALERTSEGDWKFAGIAFQGSGSRPDSTAVGA